MKVFDWLFRSRTTGRITIAQFPNIALWIFIAAVVGRRFGKHGPPRTVIDWIAVVALAWWAGDEVIRGVNPWRRFLGVVGCALVLRGVITLL